MKIVARAMKKKMLIEIQALIAVQYWDRLKQNAIGDEFIGANDVSYHRDPSLFQKVYITP